MTAAARALAETILRSAARRVAFLGLAKNVGKTTALVAVLAELHALGQRAGVTSAGRDGESFDAITGEPKPRFAVWPGQLLASASSTFEAASFPSSSVAALPFTTRFGRIEVRRAEAPGEIEMIGPSTASQTAEAAAALERAGAAIVLLDGAIGRRAFACARVADGIVLCAGLAAGASLDAAAAAVRSAGELLTLAAAPSHASVREVPGALTGATLRDAPPRRGETLVVEDFASIFLDAEDRRRLREAGAALAVRHPARLLAATSNPTAPARPPVSADRFLAAVADVLPRTAVFDVVADRQSTRT
ncbi:MAG TPA: hypothetical protein VMH79_05850 [Thermoanaerobaculia bacterium]|nr:hypothetical protein [Thermoanaerobaculia bacterium]